MRFLFLIQIIFSGLVFFGSLGPANACEMHGDQLNLPVKLPGTSVYNLSSNWINEEKHQVQFNHLAGKPRLIAMVYTKCQSACPLLVKDISSIVSRISKANANKVHIDLFSFDSEFETPESMKAFKEKYKLNERWSVNSGTKESVAELAAALGIQYKKLPSGEYIHSNVLFFINEKGEVVSKHEGLRNDPAEFIKKIDATL